MQTKGKLFILKNRINLYQLVTEIFVANEIFCLSLISSEKMPQLYRIIEAGI